MLAGLIAGRKIVREHFVRPRCAAARHWDERHVEAGLGQRRTVPGSVERYENAATIPARELLAGVEDEPVGGPVSRKRNNGRFYLRATSHLLAIAAVLRREYGLLLFMRVVAVRPAEIVAALDAHHDLAGVL